MLGVGRTLEIKSRDNITSNQPSRRPAYGTWLIMRSFMSGKEWKGNAPAALFDTENHNKSLTKRKMIWVP